jgi:hypothetical protein
VDGEVQVLVFRFDLVVLVHGFILAARNGSSPGGFVADDQVPARHAEGDVDMEWAAATVVLVRGFYGDVATRDPVEVFLEFTRFFLNAGFNSGGMAEVAECRLDWLVHDDLGILL